MPILGGCFLMIMIIVMIRARPQLGVIFALKGKARGEARNKARGKAKPEDSQAGGQPSRRTAKPEDSQGEGQARGQPEDSQAGGHPEDRQFRFSRKLFFSRESPH